MTTRELLAMLARGDSPESILAIAAGPTAAAPASPKAGAPSWLVARGARKAARRQIAAELRAAGVDLSTDAGRRAYTKAKAAAGITAEEKAAHAAFVAKA